ncbi:16077_t:CDS:1 [Acaulospora colombiana]|uniref:16077_t:CDS:1 n=1 Tax=Acaulospora colombiana TaxID=27376 RepID=A0ACA9KDJ0_9GLOM|nr:16077_t:CDS:1 [Acaulospora colombiana]
MKQSYIQSIPKLIFVLSIIFLSIYFLRPPSAEENERIEQALREKKLKNHLQNEKVAQQQQHDELSRKLNKMITDKRTKDEQEAIDITRKIIAEQLKFRFYDSIPGSSIVHNAMRLKMFRQQLECMTSRGDWVFDPTPRPIIKHKQDPLYGRCDREFVQQQSWSPDMPDNFTVEEKWNFTRESVKYVWKTPTECPMPKFDVSQACSMFSGKSFLLVGDILHFQLHELFLDYFSDDSVQCYGEISCKEHVLCDVDPNNNWKTSKMMFVRNDIISLTKNASNVNKILEYPWLMKIRHFNVIIINKGHHWQNDVSFRKGLIDLMNYLRKGFPDILIIYKATTLGHLNCQAAKKPLSSPPNATELESLPYHWGEIHRQNLIAREIVETAGGVFLDLESVMITRVDGHIGARDCLRWCIPGPMDVWLDFLFHIMKELR